VKKTMLAARAYEGEQRFRLEEIEVPRVGDDDVLIRVRSAGLTRGLLGVWHFTRLMKFLPSVLGHEIAGTIAETGRSVRELGEGQRVLVHTPLTCGDCFFCRSDRETLCSTLGTIGHAYYGQNGLDRYRRYRDGGLAEYVRAPAANVEPLPDELPFDVAARIPTLASSFRALKLTGASFGDTAVVAGATGSSGSSAVACAPLLGVTRLVAIARSREHLDRLAELAAVPIDVVPTSELPPGWERTEQLTERLVSLTRGRGADGVVDFVPLGTDVTAQAILSMRKGATAVLVGGNRVPLELPYLRVMQNQYVVRGFRGVVRRDERELIGLIDAGRLDTRKLVTHRFPLERVNDAVETILSREGCPMHVLVHP
jgi:threonine dehydrogenase-like Zn-dependent dehydrogenase